MTMIITIPRAVAHWQGPCGVAWSADVDKAIIYMHSQLMTMELAGSEHWQHACVGNSDETALEAGDDSESESATTAMHSE